MLADFKSAPCACCLSSFPMLQIAALMERCKRLEEEAAEKGRTADALRRKLAFNGAGSLASGPASIASYGGSTAGPAAAGSAANRPGSAASYSSYAAGSGNLGGSLRAARPAEPVVGAGAGAYGSTAAGYSYSGSPRAGVLIGGVGAGIGTYSGASAGYHSPTKPLALPGALGGGLLGAQSPGGSSTCSAGAPGGVAALRRSWAPGSGAGSPGGYGSGIGGM